MSTPLFNVVTKKPTATGHVTFCYQLSARSVSDAVLLCQESKTDDEVMVEVWWVDGNATVRQPVVNGSPNNTMENGHG